MSVERLFTLELIDVGHSNDGVPGAQIRLVITPERLEKQTKVIELWCGNAVSITGVMIRDDEMIEAVRGSESETEAAITKARRSI